MKAIVSRSGWQEQPAIKDMARIQFGQSSCQIEGTYVPSADFMLAGDDWIYFSHHHILWLEPSVQMKAMSMAAGWSRVRSGLPLVMLEARGPGHIALSDDSPGEVIALPIQHGQACGSGSTAFLAATGNVGYTWQQPGIWIVTGSGDDRETHYPLGMYVDIFSATGGPGLLLLHSPGNTFIRDLAPARRSASNPSSLLYKDPGVGMQLHIEYPRAPRHELATQLQLPPGVAAHVGPGPSRRPIRVRAARSPATRSAATPRRRQPRGSVNAAMTSTITGLLLLM